MVKKNIIKSVISLIIITCLVTSQSYTVMAADSSTVTKQQLSTLFDGMESIVVQLEDLGLTEEDISDLLSLSPREASFY